MIDSNATGPLSGILIADFSRVLAGPYATMLLADMGATVIKVESPVGDETRHWLPPEVDGVSTYFMSINRNKKSIVLDFTDDNDLTTAREIASRAHVVVENFKPGGLEKFALDFDNVRASNPGVIYSSVTGFGTKGGAQLPGYDLLVQACSGFMSLTGDSEGEPFRAGFAIFDVITGLHTAIGILAALYQKGIAGGDGQRVESNLLSSAMSGMVNQTAGYVLSGKIPHRMGNEHPSIYPYAPFPTKEGDIVLTIGNDRQFRALAAELGAPELAYDPRFQTSADRSAHRVPLREMLVDRLGAKNAQEWFNCFRSAGIPCAPLNDIAGGFDLATQLGLTPIVSVGAEGQPGVANPLTFSETPVSYRLTPPHIDQDREEILDWLKG